MGTPKQAKATMAALADVWVKNGTGAQSILENAVLCGGRIRATDMEVAVDLPAEDLVTGLGGVVPIRQLQRWAKLGEKIDVTYRGVREMRVQIGTVKARVNDVADVADYPATPDVDPAWIARVPTAQLVEALRRTQPATSTREDRPNLAGVAIRQIPAGLRFEASDGHRAHIATIPRIQGQGADLDEAVLVPRHAAAILIKRLPGRGEVVRLVLDKGRKLLRFVADDSAAWTIRCIDERFPGLRQVAPTTDSYARINAADLLAGIDRLCKVAGWTPTSAAPMHVQPVRSDDEPILVLRHGDDSCEVPFAPLAHGGARGNVKLNVAYLREALKIYEFPGDIDIAWRSEPGGDGWILGPMIVGGSDDRDNCAIIMPMRR